jgi:hypothetical protein
MGISIVIPAHKIVEMLNHPELVEQRKQQDELVAKEKSPSTEKSNPKPKRYPCLACYAVVSYRTMGEMPTLIGKNISHYRILGSVSGLGAAPLGFGFIREQGVADFV